MKNITPVLCLFSIVILLLAGCNPASITPEVASTNSAPPPTVSATPIPTLTQTATYAPTRTPNGWYEAIDSLLPIECQGKDPLVEDWVYENLMFLTGSCKLPSLSPDGNLLAYVIANKTGDSASNTWLSQVVKIINIRQNTSYEVFQSQKYTINEIEWSADGRLVILDASIEGKYHETIIYDPEQKKILQSLNGWFDSQSWNAQRTAFYTMNASGLSDYGPDCKNVLFVYDFLHDTLFLNLEVPFENGDFYKIVGQPFWSSDGYQLLVTVKPGLGIMSSFSVYEEILYGPASVLAIDISSPSPQQIILASDLQLDFALEIQPNGNSSISSLPYEQLDCWKIP